MREDSRRAQDEGQRYGRRGDSGAGAPSPNAATDAVLGAGAARPELAERTSAEFRRTLPALRVASKRCLK
ncbi:hypothetical protein B0H19DRAFT_1168450 [Mycena capillaripes]|nr:hypothetical protein B0H19DRAFT_1168450 [Mycena capillaripes]